MKRMQTIYLAPIDFLPLWIVPASRWRDFTAVEVRRPNNWRRTRIESFTAKCQSRLGWYLPLTQNLASPFAVCDITRKPRHLLSMPGSFTTIRIICTDYSCLFADGQECAVCRSRSFSYESRLATIFNSGAATLRIEHPDFCVTRLIIDELTRNAISSLSSGLFLSTVCPLSAWVCRCPSNSIASYHFWRDARFRRHEILRPAWARAF